MRPFSSCLVVPSIQMSYVSGNEHFIPFSRDSAFNLIKAEILGFICSHKKLLKSGVYDMPRNGCENLYPVVSDADH